MRTTIDRAGRLVVPKALREVLGVRGGEELEIGMVDGRLEIELTSPEKRVENRGEDPVIVSNGKDLPVLTVEQVRATLDRGRP